MNKSKILPYVEGAVCIAMAVVLSMIQIYKLPWGGSVTLFSMLPISMYSIKHGLKKGLGVAFIFAVYQLASGIAMDGLIAWGLTPLMLVSCILLDYIIAYTSIGLSGIFRKFGVFGWISGIIIALGIRFICHFTSGVVVFHSSGKLWEGFATDNEFIYSFLYNGAYIFPEIVLTSIGAFLIFRVPIIKKLIIGNQKSTAN
ncbi:MAG: energy-coupled thiamine transporter ThiT [Ruminococcus sp.]|nr:energy-coupled thiamine transporter ThiT [Ruminococcus sp.]